MRRANEACSRVGSSVNGRVCDESEVCQCIVRPLQMKVPTFAKARCSAVTCFATFKGIFANESAKLVGTVDIGAPLQGSQLFHPSHCKLHHDLTKYLHVPIESRQSLYCRPHIPRFHPGRSRPRGCRGRMVAHDLPLLLAVLAIKEKEGLVL